jgi:hypothetical protein
VKLAIVSSAILIAAALVAHAAGPAPASSVQVCAADSDMENLCKWNAAREPAAANASSTSST